MKTTSKTGRKLRKDSFESNHDMGKVRSHLKYIYEDLQQWSIRNSPDSFLIALYEHENSRWRIGFIHDFNSLTIYPDLLIIPLIHMSQYLVYEHSK